jgi:hypothetical protein
MKTHRMVAFAVATALAVATVPSALIAQTASIAGTAKNEAAAPYTDYTVQARNSMQGQIGGTSKLDAQGSFYIGNLPSAKYVVELVNKDGKIICTEGPYDLTKKMNKEKVNIDCDRIPAAWWLLGAAGAAGVTAGIVAAGPASPAQ